MGTPEFACPTLQRLIDRGENIVAAVTQPDRPKGRGQKLMPPPVKELALRYGIPVHQPPRVRAPEFVDLIRTGTVDLLFANESEITALYETNSFAEAAAWARRDALPAGRQALFEELYNGLRAMEAADELTTQLALDLAEQQVVARLQAREALDAHAGRRDRGLGRLDGAEVAGAAVQDLALAAQVLEQGETFRQCGALRQLRGEFTDFAFHVGGEGAGFVPTRGERQRSRGDAGVGRSEQFLQSGLERGSPVRR